MLGGTSIFGGSGSVHGTRLSWLALAVLINGLSRIPSISSASRELSDLLTALLLLGALAVGTRTRAHQQMTKRSLLSPQEK